MTTSTRAHLRDEPLPGPVPAGPVAPTDRSRLSVPPRPRGRGRHHRRVLGGAAGRSTARWRSRQRPGAARGGRQPGQPAPRRRHQATASRAGRSSWTPTSTSGSRRPPGSTRAARSQKLLQAQREIDGGRRGRAAARRLPRLGRPAPRARASATGDLPWSHEHYCAGHLFQAAVARPLHRRHAGCSTSPSGSPTISCATFGADRRHDVDGHPGSRWPWSSCTARPATARTSTWPATSSTPAATV